MKQLDEMERMAREWADGWADMRAGDTASALAEALLKVMPVVRAAISWRNDTKRTPVDVLTEVSLLRAVDTLRRGMGEE